MPSTIHPVNSDVKPSTRREAEAAGHGAAQFGQAVVQQTGALRRVEVEVAVDLARRDGVLLAGERAEVDEAIPQCRRRLLGEVGPLVLDADRLVVLADTVRALHHRL